MFPLSADRNPLSVFHFRRVTLYAEFLPMKARAKCILLIEVRKEVGASGERSFSGQAALRCPEPQNKGKV